MTNDPVATARGSDTLTFIRCRVVRPLHDVRRDAF